MTEDSTRSTARPDQHQPKYGRVGPVDPRDDPITRPAMLPDELPTPPPPGGYPGPDRAARGYDPVEYESPTVRAPLSDDTVEDDPAERTTDRHALPPSVPDNPTARIRTQPGPTGPTPPVRPPGVGHSRAGGLWTGLILSALVLIILLIFIVQNVGPVTINFLWLSGQLPTGVALLFAAIAGLLLVAIPGGLRILQLRRAARRAGRIG